MPNPQLVSGTVLATLDNTLVKLLPARAYFHSFDTRHTTLHCTLALSLPFVMPQLGQTRLAWTYDMTHDCWTSTGAVK